MAIDRKKLREMAKPMFKKAVFRGIMNFLKN
jgi:hypothetical protein